MTLPTDAELASVKLLTVRQVGDLFGIHPRTVWRLVAAGELPPPIRLGGKIVRWRVSDLAAHLAELEARR